MGIKFGFVASQLQRKRTQTVRKLSTPLCILSRTACGGVKLNSLSSKRPTLIFFHNKSQVNNLLTSYYITNTTSNITATYVSVSK